MSYQSEALLEKELITQLNSLGYSLVIVNNEEMLLENLKSQLEKFNNTVFTEKEFNTILNHLEKGNIFSKAKTLRDRFCLIRESGDNFYVRFFDLDNPGNNIYQCTHQVTVEGVYKNRYDVTILVNGLPLVQIELKRRGLEIKEAFWQVVRYQRHSYHSNMGLFQYVQFFVISNGVNTKYFANNPLTTLTPKQTFYWAEKDNKNITELNEFTAEFLNTGHLGKMISHYVVFNEAHKILMILRPYQYYAIEEIIKSVRDKQQNGYIWHTTGSGKTLTSFKASQIIMDSPLVHKVVFVVDRRDLDYQTMKEFNSFKKGCVDVTNNTRSLVKQFKEDAKLIVTTIQKLNNAVSRKKFRPVMEHLKDKPVVFIFDECHRSQFGDTHKRIVDFFTNCRLFGFTGTPIFTDNAHKDFTGRKRTTKELFGDCLHKYVITDAIRDQNVLRFKVEYYGRYKKKGGTFVDIEVEDIDRQELIESEDRCEKIVDHIIAVHDMKTHNKEYSAIFATSSISSCIQYYDLFKKKKNEGMHNLRITADFSYAANEEDPDAMGFLPDDDEQIDPEHGSLHSREKLDQILADYNAMYKTAFSTRDSRQMENYYKDISRRLKEREKASFQDKDRLDILLVVNMFLTGFDAKKVNTLYVDKKLRYHGLVQAFSRTNRILNERKSHGNILCYRNLKANVDEAVALFSNKKAKEIILMPEYEELLNEFNRAWYTVLSITPTVNSVNQLKDEDYELKFIKAFREVMRLLNVLKTYSEFSWEDLAADQQAFNDYSGKYLDLHDKVKQDRRKEKVSVLNDVDFELELIHRDEINVAYILKLLARLIKQPETETAELRKSILDTISGDVNLRSKRELIERFILENLPNITDADTIEDEFEKYWQEQKAIALKNLCEEEKLDQKQFSALIETYIFTDREPLHDEVFKCLDNRPSVLQARVIAERIIAKMKEYVEVFVEGISA